MSEKTLCFSGHRPEKLPNGGDTSAPEVKRLISVLHLAIKEAIDEGYTSFITGVAKGIDIWAANYILNLKIDNPKIKLICVIPYQGHGDAWKGLDKWNIGHILEKADEIHTVSLCYTKTCMRLRNEYMVDRSSKLIAVVQNYRSGTGQTIRYAQKQGIDLRIIDITDNNEIFQQQY